MLLISWKSKEIQTLLDLVVAILLVQYVHCILRCRLSRNLMSTIVKTLSSMLPLSANKRRLLSLYHVARADCEIGLVASLVAAVNF